MNTITIFNKEIMVRDRYCGFFSNEPSVVETPYINLYIRFKGCNASCKFCNSQNDASKFNMPKYLEILKELKSKIRINKVAFTGGEPTLNLSSFENVVRNTYDIVKTYMSVNTNGLNLKKLYSSDIIDTLSCVSLSRHHYKDKINNEILGFQSSPTRDIKYVTDKRFHMTCNLIKNYIDSETEVNRFLEYVALVGCVSASFVSLMPLNKYCEEAFIDFNAICTGSKRLNLTKRWSYKDCCRCDNWVYIPRKSENLVKVYHKNTYKPFDIDINLAFDGEYLRAGFTKEIIY